jgi:hypothetical protein
MCSVDMGETLGLYHDIKWANKLRPTNIDFEVDSEKVVGYFRRGSIDITEFGEIMEITSVIYFSKLFCRVYSKSCELGTHISINVPTCITSLISNVMM